MKSGEAVKAPRPDYPSFFAPRGQSRSYSAIRQTFPLLKVPGMLSLASGSPSASTFPIASMSITLSDGSTQTTSGAELSAALQYGATSGADELVQRLRVLQDAEHAPPYPYALHVVPGSQFAIYSLLDALLAEGDTLAVETPTYSGVLTLAQAVRCAVVACPTDADGIVPAGLDALLGGWDATAQGSKRPRVLYVMPTGSNPAGSTLPLQRRLDLLRVASARDLLVIEDDAYYHLTHAGAQRLPSLLSLDTAGRVVRCDSFSKTVCPGLRLGLVTGPPALVELVAMHTSSSLIHASGPSQLLLLQLLRAWRAGESPSPPATAGTAGFIHPAPPLPAGAASSGAGVATPAALPAAYGGLAAHLEALQAFYARQCGALCAAIDRHLRAEPDGTGALLVEYTRPTAGMFLWLRLLGVADSSELVLHHARERKVLLLPGAAFLPPGHPPSSFVRVSFSSAPPEDIDAAVQRLGDLLREARLKLAVK